MKYHVMIAVEFAAKDAKKACKIVQKIEAKLMKNYSWAEVREIVNVSKNTDINYLSQLYGTEK